MTLATPNFWILLPARRQSTRLPDKPLLEVHGLPLVVQTAQAGLASGARRVAVATDDAEIAGACRDHGLEVIMTRADHPSGTDRLAEAVEQMGAAPEQIVVNLQADEPLIPPSLLADLARCLQANPEAAMATVVTPIHTDEELLSPHVVKAILRPDNTAITFSRACIPWHRDAWLGQSPALVRHSPMPPLRHLGLYSYRAQALSDYTRLAPTALEAVEQLEQLRWIAHHRLIVTMQVETPPPIGIDTPDDLERVRRLFADRSL